MTTRKPVVTHVDLQGTRGSFRMQGNMESFANALRHAMIRDTHLPATTRVVIHKNTSIIPDDYIAHRCGLIPLRGPPEGRMQLVARGPGRVLSSHIRSATHEVAVDDIIIASLGVAGEPEMDLIVESDFAHAHARHCAAVAPRFTLRTRGFDLPECFCETSAFGARCKDCGLHKRPDSLHDAPVDVLFQFETTGARTARELLADALSALKKNNQLIHSNC